jgi:hypothetical protein
MSSSAAVHRHASHSPSSRLPPPWAVALPAGEAAEKVTQRQRVEGRTPFRGGQSSRVPRGRRRGERDRWCECRRGEWGRRIRNRRCGRRRGQGRLLKEEGEKKVSGARGERREKTHSWGGRLLRRDADSTARCSCRSTSTSPRERSGSEVLARVRRAVTAQAMSSQQPSL